MNLSFGNAYRHLRVGAKQNSPLISAVAAGIGVGVTAYLTAKATFKAYDILHEVEVARYVDKLPIMTNKERIKTVWKCYIPPAVAGVSTVALIGNSHRLATNRTLATQAALGVAQQAYSDYRSKVIEDYGERKDQTIQARVAEDRMKQNPPPSTEILMTGPGVVLCCELFTGRYFAANPVKLKEAQNKVNERVIRDSFATLDDFYELVGLPYTSRSANLGWRPDELMELSISTILSEDGRPCLSFDYNYVMPL